MDDFPELVLHSGNREFRLTAESDNSPKRGPCRPRGSLKGEPAARVVRTLIDYRGPLTISDLLGLPGVSTGATYRIRDYLVEEGLLDWLPSATYQVPDWQKLLRE